MQSHRPIVGLGLKADVEIRANEAPDTPGGAESSKADRSRGSAEGLKCSRPATVEVRKRSVRSCLRTCLWNQPPFLPARLWEPRCFGVGPAAFGQNGKLSRCGGGAVRPGCGGLSEDTNPVALDGSRSFGSGESQCAPSMRGRPRVKGLLRLDGAPELDRAHDGGVCTRGAVPRGFPNGIKNFNAKRGMLLVKLIEVCV